MPVSPFPSPKSSMSLRRNAPPPLHVPCSPLLSSPPIPQDNTIPRTTSKQRVDRSWSLASIPIFLDQGEDQDDDRQTQAGEEDQEELAEDERAQPGPYLAYNAFANPPSASPSRPDPTSRPSKAFLVPEDVDHADTAYSAAPVPSPRRALRSLGRPINNGPVRRDGGPLTPGDEEPASLLLVRRQSVASSADSSSMGSSTGTMVGLGMRRDESEGALSLTGTFGQKGSFNVNTDRDDVDEEDERSLTDKREADRMSMFSLSEYYSRDDSAGGPRSTQDDDDQDRTGREEVLGQNDWDCGRNIDSAPESTDPDDYLASLDVPSLATSTSARTIVRRSVSPTATPHGPRSPPRMLPRSKSPPPPLTNLRPRSPDPNLPDFLRSAPSSPATPSPSPARSDLSALSVGFPPQSARSASSGSSSTPMTPDGKRAGGHRVSSSYSSPRNSRASMFVQQGKDISIDLWIDQEGFRAIRPRLSCTRYSPPNPYPSSSASGTPVKQQGHQRSRSTSFGSGSPTTNRNSTEIAAATGFFEFGMKKRQSWAFHHAVLDKSPVLRRLTLSDDDTKDFLSRQGDLSVKSNGVYTLKGAEDKGALEWKFEYEVDDRISVAGKIIAGEKVLTPISFSCAPDLLSPARGKKPGFLSVVKKTVVLPNLISEKLEIAPFPPTPPPTGPGSSPLSSTTSLPPLNSSSGKSSGRPSTSSGSTRPSTSSSSRPSTPSGANGSRPTTPASRTRQVSYGTYLSSTPSPSPTPQTAPLPLLPPTLPAAASRKRSASLSSRLRPFTPPSTSSVPLPVPAPALASGLSTYTFGTATSSSSRSAHSSSASGTVHAFGSTKTRSVAVSPLPFIPPDHPPPQIPGQPWAGVPMGLGASMGLPVGGSGPGKKGVLKGGGKGRPSTADPGMGRRW